MTVNIVIERQDLTDTEDVEPLCQLLQKQVPTEKLKKSMKCCHKTQHTHTDEKTVEKERLLLSKLLWELVNS